MTRGGPDGRSILMREAVATPMLLAVAAAAGTVTWLLARGPHADTGSLQWLLLAAGVASVAIALFDRKLTVDQKTGWRARAAVYLLGVLGARIAYALVGGIFLGVALALLT